MWVLLSVHLPKGHICESTLSSSRLLVYLFLLAGRSRSPTRNRSFSVFAKSYGSCKCVSIPISSLSPPYLSKRFSAIASSLALASIPCFYPFFEGCLVPSKLLYGQHSVLVSSRTLPYLLDYAIPPYSSSPFATFPLSAMAGSLLFGMFLTLYCHFNFLPYLFVLSGYISTSALNFVFLVVLEHATNTNFCSCCHLHCSRSLRSLPMFFLRILALVHSHQHQHQHQDISLNSTVKVRIC